MQTTKRRSAGLSAHIGSVLKNARLNKKIKPLTLARKLSITPRQLDNLERWDVKSLPKGVYLQGLVDKYAKAVEYPIDNLRRQFPEVFQEAKVSAKPRQVWHSKRFFVLTRIVKVAVILVVLALAGGYVIWQSSSLATAPKLDIYEPQNGITVHQQTVGVSGQTSQGAQVYVNGSPVLVDTNGTFETDVVLSPGTNTIEIRSVNTLSRQAVQTRTLIYETFPTP